MVCTHRAGGIKAHFMAHTGSNTAVIYHPETDVPYEIYIRWRYHYDPGVHTFSNGDPGYPPEEELDYDVEVLSIDGVAIAGNVKLPDWVTSDMIEEHIDLY